VITSEAVMNNKKVYEIDTSGKNVEESVNDVFKILEEKTEEFKVGRIDWLEKYHDWIELS